MNFACMNGHIAGIVFRRTIRLRRSLETRFRKNLSQEIVDTQLQDEVDARFVAVVVDGVRFGEIEVVQPAGL